MTHFHFVKVQTILCTFTFKENSVVASKRLEQNKTQQQQQNAQTGDPSSSLIPLEVSGGRDSGSCPLCFKSQCCHSGR